MVDLNWLTLFLGVVLPMATGLVTNRVADPGLKAMVLGVLSAAGGIGNEIYSVGGDLSQFGWNASLANAVTVFLVAVGMHYGLLRPTGVTGSDGALQTGSLSGGLGGAGPSRHSAAE